MATGIRARLIRDFFIAAKKQNVEIPKLFDEMVIVHYKKLMQPGFINLTHNHGISSLMGLNLLAEILPVSEGIKAREFVDSSVIQLFHNQFDPNFIHKEHSPHYHIHAVRELERFIDDFERKSVSVDKLRTLVERARLKESNFYLPDGRLMPFGDTDNQRAESLENYPYPPSQQDVIWCESGYFKYAKDGGTYLAATNNHHSDVHKHSDNLSFIFGYRGKDVFVDPGKYSYTKDPVRDLVLSALNHNTVHLSVKEWKASDLRPASLTLNTLREKIGIENIFGFEGSMAVDGHKKAFRLSRRVTLAEKCLTIKDTVSSSNEETYFTNFVLGTDSRIIDLRANKVTIDIGLALAEMVIIEKPGDLTPKIELCGAPFSNSYGEWRPVIKIRVQSLGNLTTKIQIKDK